MTVQAAAGTEPAAVPATRSRARVLSDGVLGAGGALLGVAPHVLHHVGFLAGTALVAGSGGTALFAGVGLVASVPLLLRLRRRFNSWRAPAVGLAAVAAMFALSSFVIGPAISGEDPAPTAPRAEHPEHH